MKSEIESLVLIVSGSMVGFLFGSTMFKDNTSSLKRKAAAYKGLWLKTQKTLKQWKSVAWRGRK